MTYLLTLYISLLHFSLMSYSAFLKILNQEIQTSSFPSRRSQKKSLKSAEGTKEISKMMKDSKDMRGSSIEWGKKQNAWNPMGNS